MQRRDQAVLAALVIGLLIGAAATYALAGARLGGTTTTTTCCPVVTITSTKTVTASQQGLAVASEASDGLDLSTSINATEIAVGHNLNISVSLFNTLGNSSTFQWGSGGTGGNWTFQGVPLVTWPECSLAPHDIRSGFQFPIEVLVLSGNYTAQQLSSFANVNLDAFPCSLGSGVVIPIYTFEPESNLVNITYFADGGVGLGPVGVYRAASNFTLGGYWNFTSLEEQANESYISEPALCQLCKVPSSTPFAPGVYTIGVADEMGQYDILHFQVIGSG